jgi:tRNA 2-thiouridine synthesizing protein B
MLLHLVSVSAGQGNALSSCLRCVCDDAVLLLLQDGVYAALKGSDSAHLILESGVRCYVLTDDIHSRGLRDKIEPQFQLASYDDFVDLSVSCHAVQSWY